MKKELHIIDSDASEYRLIARDPNELFPGDNIVTLEVHGFANRGEDTASIALSVEEVQALIKELQSRVDKVTIDTVKDEWNKWKIPTTIPMPTTTPFFGSGL